MAGGRKSAWFSNDKPVSNRKDAGTYWGSVLWSNKNTDRQEICEIRKLFCRWDEDRVDSEQIYVCVGKEPGLLWTAAEEKRETNAGRNPKRNSAWKPKIWRSWFGRGRRRCWTIDSRGNKRNRPADQWRSKKKSKEQNLEEDAEEDEWRLSSPPRKIWRTKRNIRWEKQLFKDGSRCNLFPYERWPHEKRSVETRIQCTNRDRESIRSSLFTSSGSQWPESAGIPYPGIQRSARKVSGDSRCWFRLRESWKLFLSWKARHHGMCEVSMVPSWTEEELQK